MQIISVRKVSELLKNFHHRVDEWEIMPPFSITADFFHHKSKIGNFPSFSPVIFFLSLLLPIILSGMHAPPVRKKVSGGIEER